MWSHQRLFVRQTGSSLRILEVSGFRFRQFSGSGDHIFQHISTKCHVQIYFSNADFVFNGEWNRKQKSDFRDVQIPVSFSALNRPVFDRTQLLYACFQDNLEGWWRWALVSPHGVAPSQMVGVSTSVNVPLHHKIQKFSSGTGSPGWSQKNGRKKVVVKRLWFPGQPG